MTDKSAAEVLRLSTRQVKRIKKKVRLNGPGATVHGNRERKPINAVDDKVKDLVVELRTKKYGGLSASLQASQLNISPKSTVWSFP